jgi:type IV pilus assembly protein PilP
MRYVLLSCLVLVLTGCNQGMSDLNDFMDRQDNIPVPPIDPLPQLTPHEVFEYSATGLRDPFSNDLEIDEGDGSQNLTVAEGGAGPDLTRRKEFLETFPLDSLTMVGTYQQEDNYWALIVDPDGTIHPVSTGQYLGHNYGQVTAIYENEIQLTEWLNDGLGAWRERQAAVALKEE